MTTTELTDDEKNLLSSYDDADKPRIHAIASATGCTIEEACEYFEKEDWVAYTDEEADDACKDYIEDSLWAFNASFIIENSCLPWEAEEMIQSFQEKKCEGANDTIKAIIGDDIDDFVSAAISADGRGHFLNPYDGVEYEEQTGDTVYYVYRRN